MRSIRHRGLVIAGVVVLVLLAGAQVVPRVVVRMVYPTGSDEPMRSMEDQKVPFAALVEGRRTFSEGVDAHTPFRIGSVTKSFTAALVILLSHDGLVDLDAPVSDYLDVPEGPTVRQLLQHRAGIIDPGDHWFEWAYVTPDEPLDTATYLTEAVWGEPGRFEYSNVGYFLLSDLVEQVTGESIAQALRARILDPLDLGDTCWPGLEADCDSIPGLVDTSEFGWDPGSIETLETFTAVDSLAGSAGALVSSLADLERFAKAVYSDELGDLGLMRETRIPGIQPAALGMKYGAGTMEFIDGSYGHLGQTIGFQSLIRHHPGSDEISVVLIGHSSIDPLAVEAALKE